MTQVLRSFRMFSISEMGTFIRKGSVSLLTAFIIIMIILNQNLQFLSDENLQKQSF